MEKYIMGLSPIFLFVGFITFICLCLFRLTLLQKKDILGIKETETLDDTIKHFWKRLKNANKNTGVTWQDIKGCMRNKYFAKEVIKQQISFIPLRLGALRSLLRLYLLKVRNFIWGIDD